jgi:secreted PhoX family phosphatase
MLKWSGAAGMLAVAAPMVQACTMPPPPPGTDPSGLVLLPGFSSRVIARAGESVAGTGQFYRWFPDGAATFADPATPGGWYLAVNHEVTGGNGGVTSIRFAADGTIVGAQAVLSDTSSNCAGGATAWGTWLSCEEHSRGYVWECDPTGSAPPVKRTALGAFSHEAAAVAADGRIYLTEDRTDGALYRFTPATPGDLSAGVLEVATGAAPGTLTWVPVPDPAASTTSTRLQVPGTTRFDGGEGIDTLGDEVWFTTKGDLRVWRYRISTAQVDVRYQAGGASTLDAVDNLWVDDASGALVVAEDGGNMELVAIRPDDSAVVLARIPGQDGSEVTGPCFSPDGQRLYFSSQRAPVGAVGAPLGVTYEVTGPFDTLLGRS